MKKRSTAMTEYPEETNNLFGNDNAELNLNFVADNNMSPNDQNDFY